MGECETTVKPELLDRDEQEREGLGVGSESVWFTGSKLAFFSRRGRAGLNASLGCSLQLIVIQPMEEATAVLPACVWQQV